MHKIVDGIKKGDIFSEVMRSYYTYKGKNGSNYILEDVFDSVIINVDEDFFNELDSAEQYQKTKQILKQDSFWTAEEIKLAISRNEYNNNNCPKVGELRKGVKSIMEDLIGFAITISYDSKKNQMSDNEIIEEFEKELIKQRVKKKNIVTKATTLLKEIIKTKTENIEKGYLSEYITEEEVFSFTNLEKVQNQETDIISKINHNDVNYICGKGFKYIIK